MTRPRVLMLCEQFLPVVGGAEIGSYRLAQSLISRGVHAEVLALRTDPGWPRKEALAGGVVVHRVADVDLNHAFPNVRRLGLGRLSELLRMLRTAMALRRHVSRFDVVHAHNLSSPLTAFALRRVRRLERPIVATAVNSGDWFDLRTLARHRRVGAGCVKSVLRDIDHWVAVSRAVASDLRATGVPAERITQIPYGVSVDTGAVALPPVASRFLHVGRLATTAPRDVVGLVEAFEAVVRANPAAELAIVGGGDKLDDIRSVVASSPAADRIHLPGTVDSAAWRRWAHCMAHPSFAEGMSNALLEGMASGLACVAYDIPPNREALDDGAAGVLVPVGDRERLGAELTALALRPGAAAEWGRRARARAADVYDIAKVGEQTENLYHLVVRGRPRHDDPVGSRT